MKKVYIEPFVKVILVFAANVMQNASPGVTGDTPDGTIPYSGVDEDGSKDPEAKPFHEYSVWEE